MLDKIDGIESELRTIECFRILAIVLIELLGIGEALTWFTCL
jgi:hypothetical protein